MAPLLTTLAQLDCASEVVFQWWWFQSFELGWNHFDVYNLRCCYHAVGHMLVFECNMPWETCLCLYANSTNPSCSSADTSLVRAVCIVLPKFCIVLCLPSIIILDPHNKIFQAIIQYADAWKAKSPILGSSLKCLRTSLRNNPVEFQIPSSSVIGTEIGVYFALGAWMLHLGLDRLQMKVLLLVGLMSLPLSWQLALDSPYTYCTSRILKLGKQKRNLSCTICIFSKYFSRISWKCLPLSPTYTLFRYYLPRC